MKAMLAEKAVEWLSKGCLLSPLTSKVKDLGVKEVESCEGDWSGT